MIEFGPLDALARDPTVTDVAITCEGRVWADRGGGMTECRLPMPLRTPRIVREYAVRLCAQLGRRLDDACPIADASSEDGIRVHAVIAPLVAQGAAVTIRFPDRRLLGLTGLRDAGMFPPDWLTLLRNLVKNRARVLISGGTGSGKTTLLKALLAECDSLDRIVTVEEVRELGESRTRQPCVDGGERGECGRRRSRRTAGAGQGDPAHETGSGGAGRMPWRGNRRSAARVQFGPPWRYDHIARRWH